MNTQVTATGMQISAKNESGSLIIGAQTYTGGVADLAPTLTSVQTANLTTVNLGLATHNYTASFAVKPSAHKNTATDIASLDAFGNWSYKIADLPSSYASSTASTALTAFTDYVIYYDLFITVAAGSPAMSNLKCNATIQASGASNEVRNGVRVLVASDTASEEFFNAHTEGTTPVDSHSVGSTVLATSITNDALVHIRVYIYLDGEDATVFTNNFGNLASATISLAFVAENPTP